MQILHKNLEDGRRWGAGHPHPGGPIPQQGQQNEQRSSQASKYKRTNRGDRMRSMVAGTCSRSQDISVYWLYSAPNIANTMNRLLLIALATTCVPSIACAQQSTQGAVPAMYATKAEAEQAAPQFNCSGAHQMGDKWMPCVNHPQKNAASGVPPMYATKAEAEKAAPQFNCSGAHQMGDKWMPCSEHGQVKSNAQ